MRRLSSIARKVPSTSGRLTLALTAILLLASCASPPETKPVGPLAFPKPPDAPRFYYERTILGTGAVKQLSDNDRLRSMLTGADERDGIGFAKPFDVAVHQGRVFVSDTVQRVVLAMDFTAGASFAIGDRGDEGDLFKPLGLAVDAQGKVYVCDTQVKKVLVYDRDGNWLHSIGLGEQMNRPSGIDVSPDGSRLFVVDTGGVESDWHRIAVYDLVQRRHVRNIGSRGTADGQFNLPRDVSLGPDGLLYVTDGGNFRVQVLDQDGNFVRAWGSPGRHLGQFTRPKGISASHDGNLYVVDAAFGNFQLFTPSGELLLFIGARSEVPGPAKYMLPSGIDVDEDGRVYMLDQFFRKLDVYRPASLNADQGYIGRSLAQQ